MKCWYCKKAEMEEDKELGKEWFKCPECNATWVDTSKMGTGGALYMGTPWGSKYAVSKAEAEKLGYTL